MAPTHHSDPLTPACANVAHLQLYVKKRYRYASKLDDVLRRKASPHLLFLPEFEGDPK